MTVIYNSPVSPFDSWTNGGQKKLSYADQTNGYQVPTSSRFFGRLLDSPQEQIRDLVSFLGLNKSDLAKVFGVSRPALYAWISGKSEPQKPQLDRFAMLGRVVNKIRWDGQTPLFHGYLEPLNLALMKSDWDERELTSMIGELWGQTQTRKQRVGAVSALTDSSEGERTLDDHLTSLGTEG